MYKGVARDPKQTNQTCLSVLQGNRARFTVEVRYYDHDDGEGTVNV